MYYILERQKNGSLKVMSWEFYEVEMSLTPAQLMKELVNAHKILINASKRFAPIVLKAKAKDQSLILESKKRILLQIRRGCKPFPWIAKAPPLKS